MRLNRSVVAGVAGLVLLAGCSGGDEPDPGPTEPGPAAPEGDVVVIEPLDAVPGGERTEFHGTAIDVPSGMVADTSTTSDGTEVLALRPSEESRAAVTVTVTAGEGADASAVDVSSSQTEAELAVNTAVDELERRPVEWEGMPYAVLTTLDLEVDADAGVVHEVALVTVHDPDGTMVVGVSAEAPKGELEDSDAWAALRTFRFLD